MSDGRGGDTISRAEYGRFTHELANYQQGNVARAEREQRRRLKAEAQEKLRMRGQQLREAQKLQLATTASKIDATRQQAHAVGEELRAARIELRLRREQQQNGWEQHGFGLTQKYSTRLMTEGKREAKAAHDAKRAKEATDMRNHILAANKRTDERVRKEIDDMAERVRKENDHTVTRHAKQAYVNEKWDKAVRHRGPRPPRAPRAGALLPAPSSPPTTRRRARQDAMREEMDLLRRRRKAQELGYLQTAVALTQSLCSPEPAREARRKAEADRGAVGQEMRRHRARLRQQKQAQRDGWQASQDANHEARQAARVTTEEVNRETDDSSSGYNPILQFFGFRKRGGPEKAAYQPSYGGGEEVHL